jgi:hypothetical protein
MLRPLPIRQFESPLTQADVDQYVDDHLDVSVLAKANQCKDIMCVFQKLMCHKVFRNWNQWQSLLLHRYFWNMQLGAGHSNMSIQHVQLKHTRKRGSNGKWVFSQGEMMPSSWHVQDLDIREDLFAQKEESNRSEDVPDINVLVVEMWMEVRNGLRKRCARDGDGGRTSAAWFHNLVIIQQEDNLVCIPFDKQAEEWAKDLPLERMIRRGATKITKFVHRPDYPFLPLLWFHVAVQQGKQAQIAASLQKEIRDVGGTAFFELHLVDALVKPGETMEYLLQFADERATFAHNHMTPYQDLL